MRPKKRETAMQKLANTAREASTPDTVPGMRGAVFQGIAPPMPFTIDIKSGSRMIRPTRLDCSIIKLFLHPVQMSGSDFLHVPIERDQEPEAHRPLRRRDRHD